MCKTLCAALLLLLAWFPASAQVFESENGAHFRIQGTAVPADGSSTVLAYIVDDDGQLTRVMFDCHGRYGFLELMRWRTIPSRSVLAAISRRACR